MLSALAKYIFGGIMGDAPETTPMQYETREVNDWLLVDMPDQAIDDEDMDSESDDDDILTAVPLLMAEEIMYPRQIVLSYEEVKANSVCDNSYGKVRKDFHDKLHSASSKVQVHSGDKIQGNFIDKIEAVSIEIEDDSHDKMQDISTEVQESSKCKKSRSKKSKPKKSKKNRIQNKFDVKYRDISVTVKENSNDNMPQDCSDKIQSSVPEISDISEDEIRNNFVNEVQDVSVALTENSIAGIQDILDKILENDEIQKNLNDKNEFVSPVLQDNTGDNIQDGIVDKAEVISVAVQENSNDRILGFDAEIQETLDTIHDDEAKKEFDDQVEITFYDKIQRIPIEFYESSKKSKSKRCKSKKSKKSKMQLKFNAKYQNISVAAQENYINVFEENFNNNVPEKFDNEIQSISSEVSHNFGDKIQGKVEDVSNAAIGNSNTIQYTFAHEMQDIYATVHEKCDNEIHENSDFQSQKKDDEILLQSSEIEINSRNEIQSLSDEAVSVEVVENCNGKGQDAIVTEIQDFSVTAEENYDNEFQEISNNLLEIFGMEDQSCYYEVQNNSDDEIKNNFINNVKTAFSEEENFQVKNEDTSFEFQEKSNDGILDSFADFWDIYTKIQTNSDDEVQEMSDDEMNEDSNEEPQEVSDDEMNENCNVELQEVLDNKMNENYDDEVQEITDDEMNDNSDNEIKETSDDERYERPCRMLRFLYGQTKARSHNRRFRASSEEESEESDDEIFVRRNKKRIVFTSRFKCKAEKETDIAHLARDCSNFIEELKQRSPQVSKHHTGCVPYTEYELAEYFNFEPRCFYASQSLHYPSSYALAVAEFYANLGQYNHACPQQLCFPEYCNTFAQKCKKRSEDKSTSPAPAEPNLITSSAEILQNLIDQKCTLMPTKPAVVLEHVKDLKPAQQAIQFEMRKYLTRSQLNRQNRNYIYQSSVKTNRRRNLQRNHSGANNNRKC